VLSLYLDLGHPHLAAEDPVIGNQCCLQDIESLLDVSDNIANKAANKGTALAVTMLAVSIIIAPGTVFVTVNNSYMMHHVDCSCFLTFAVRAVSRYT